MLLSLLPALAMLLWPHMLQGKGMSQHRSMLPCFVSQLCASHLRNPSPAYTIYSACTVRLNVYQARNIPGNLCRNAVTNDKRYSDNGKVGRIRHAATPRTSTTEGDLCTIINLGREVTACLLTEYCKSLSAC